MRCLTTYENTLYKWANIQLLIMATCSFIYNDGFGRAACRKCKCTDDANIQQTNTGVENRVWYLNIISLTMVLVSSLIVGTVNAPIDYTETQGNKTVTMTVPRYQRCALAGATKANGGCNVFVDGDDASIVMERVFTLSLVLALLNSATLIIGAVAHVVDSVTELHFNLQMPLSSINLGIFAGIVGWMTSTDTVWITGANMEESLYMKNANIYALALVGLVFSILDLGVFSALSIFVFGKEKCSTKQIKDLK